MSDIKLSMIIPAFNEEGAIVQVIEHLQASLKASEIQYEIILVDDGSTDKTVELAKPLGITILRNTENMGTGYSRKKGVLAAKGEIVGFIDADGTYDSSELPEMLSYFPRYDQVNGARRKEVGNFLFLRIIAKFLLRNLTSHFLGKYIPDLNTGLKLMKKDVLLQYIDLLPQRFSSVTAMTIFFLGGEYDVKYIPTDYFGRIGQAKFHPIKDTAESIYVITRCCFKVKPLRTIQGIVELFVIPIVLGVLAISSSFYLKVFLFDILYIILKILFRELKK